MDDTDKITLFLDVGTKGDGIGQPEWLCHARVLQDQPLKVRAYEWDARTRGAIEEVWIANPESTRPYEPTYRVIGGVNQAESAAPGSSHF